MVAERGHFVHYVHFPQDTSAALKQCGTVVGERGHCDQYVHFPKDTSAAVKQHGTVVGVIVIFTHTFLNIHQCRKAVWHCGGGHCVHYVNFP